MTNLFCFAPLGVHSIHDGQSTAVSESGVACYVLSIKAKSPLMKIAVNFTDFPFCES